MINIFVKIFSFLSFITRKDLIFVIFLYVLWFLHFKKIIRGFSKTLRKQKGLKVKAKFFSFRKSYTDYFLLLEVEFLTILWPKFEKNLIEEFTRLSCIQRIELTIFNSYKMKILLQSEKTNIGQTNKSKLSFHKEVTSDTQLTIIMLSLILWWLSALLLWLRVLNVRIVHSSLTRWDRIVFGFIAFGSYLNIMGSTYVVSLEVVQEFIFAELRTSVKEHKPSDLSFILSWFNWNCINKSLIDLE